MTATDEFWHSPILADESPAILAAPASSTADSATASGDGDFSEVVALPAAHRQLLSSDSTSVEGLKGYDHKRDVFGGDGCADHKSSRGSWLVGLTDPILPILPGLVRVPSGASLESDECSTSSDSNDEISISASPKKRARRGISFNATVKVQPIPHSDALTEYQRRKMYSTSWEVRQNKIRNKKEFRYACYDWRTATEEWEMSVDMVTGELIHPAHEYPKL